MTDQQLHVFSVDNVDWWVAYSLEDLHELLTEQCCYDADDIVELSIEQEDDATVLKACAAPNGEDIASEDDEPPWTPERGYVRRTAREWAEREGRGQLFSRNI